MGSAGGHVVLPWDIAVAAEAGLSVCAVGQAVVLAGEALAGEHLAGQCYGSSPGRSVS